MPTINLKPEVYKQLQDVMANELDNKLKASNPKEAMLEVVKNKFGVTFNSMVQKLINEYKTNHKIK